MDFGQLLAGLFSGSALATIISMLITWTKAKADVKITEAKAKSEIDLSKDKQDFDQQQLIINDLRQQVGQLWEAIKDCVNDRNKLHHDVGHLQGRLDEQKNSLEHLRQTTSAESREALVKAGEVAARGVEVAANLVATAAGASMSDSAIRLEIAKKQDKDRPTEPDLAQVHD